ncbi:MAG: gliding motility-associated C-terminal domain-containing protein [Muribaculaceae bacterium]|nr:gliding motility-associated C-terminal domain-containing protein [Muribaculaceae bacterium]
MTRLKYILLMSALVASMTTTAQISFTGNDREIMEIIPEANTGLSKIYVLNGADGVGMSYTATTMNPVTWFTYGEQGGAVMQEIYDVIDDRDNPYLSSIAQVKTDCGYIIEEGTTRTYVWVTDYSKYPLYLSTIAADNDGDCGTATIHVEGSGSDIPFYTITGVRRTLSRDLQLKYYNLVWNDTAHYQQELVTNLQAGYKPVIVIPAPFCNTTFTLTGDRFMDFWGMTQTIESDTYTTQAVEVHTTAVQEMRDNKNEKKSGDQGLGGSAPCHILFTAYSTDAVVHKEWQMATDQDFNNILLRINADEVEETFTEAGTSYWRFIGSNADGTCESYSETYTVNIGESELVCPNVFTPGSSEGVNDVWKVSYRSITEFHCVIFNRWGNKIIELNDPGQGWDGTYGGKLVPAGVYYYVINARGSDGKQYKMDGDINIIRYRRMSHGTDDSGSTVVEPEG